MYSLLMLEPMGNRGRKVRILWIMGSMLLNNLLKISTININKIAITITIAIRIIVRVMVEIKYKL